MNHRLTLIAAAVLGLGCNAADAESQGPPTRVDEPAYSFQWVRTILGPCCTESGMDLVVDSDGGVLIAGKRGGLDLDRDGSVDIQTFGLSDPLILKTYDDNVRGWVQGPGGPSWDEARGIASDRHGGAFAVGDFTDSMRIAGGTILSAGGRTDGFVARYDQNGEALWARPVGGPEGDQLFDVASDAAGNVFVIGSVKGAVDIDRDGTVDVDVAGASAFLLASFDPDGRLRWARASGGPATVVGRAIAIGPGDEIYIGAHYGNGAPDLNGDGTPDVPAAATVDRAAAVTPQSDFNGFYARFDSSGEMVWVRAISGPASQAVGSLAVAGNGDVLVLGGFTDSADLDGDGTADLEFASMEDRIAEDYAEGNSFLLRIDPDGARIWARRYAAMAAHVVADATRIVVSGSYSGALDLDDDGVLERGDDEDPQTEGFAAILDGDGRLRHVFTIVGPDGDVANAAGFSPDGGTLYVTGYTKLGADFDGDGVIEAASACHQLGDLYLASYAVPD
jgi:hypothetical protein